MNSRNNNTKGNDKGKTAVTASGKKNENLTNDNASKEASENSNADGDLDQDELLDKAAKKDLKKALGGL